jgi:hypothetical protein
VRAGQVAGILLRRCLGLQSARTVLKLNVHTDCTASRRVRPRGAKPRATGGYSASLDLLIRQYRIRRIRVYSIGCSPIKYPPALDAAFASELMWRHRA